jgi:prepilin-type N-terminal cleavage/methylation domain-containing protein
MKNRQTGFTLVEVLVVVAIIGLMSTMGMVSYFRFADTSRIRGAAQEAQTFIRDIQNRAKMGDRGEGDCATNGGAGAVITNRFLGWELTFGGDTITARPMCDGGMGVPKQYFLPQPTLFIDAEPLFFPSLYYTGAGAQINNGDDDVWVKVTDNINPANRTTTWGFKVELGGAIGSLVENPS